MLPLFADCRPVCHLIRWRGIGMLGQRTNWSVVGEIEKPRNNRSDVVSQT